MLKDSKAFSSFSVDSLEKAKEFYGNTLGLEVSGSKEGLSLKTSGRDIFVYQKDNHVPATFTILNFPMEDVEKTVDELTGKGVKFEIYTEGEMKTNEKGISSGVDMKIAWFKDPAGNFLSVLNAKM